MVKGFAPGYIAEYNFDSDPTFAVGEFWDSNAYMLTQWVDGTKMYGRADGDAKACSAFDFATHELQRGDEIKALSRARKYAGVHSGSYIKTEVHGDDYVAIIGDKPEESSTLIVKIGPGFDFRPDDEWGLVASGDGYAVWVRKSKKGATKGAVDAPKEPFPIP